MRLTEDQAMATIDAMRTTNEAAKDALRRQWRSGDAGARFVVFGLYRKQKRSMSAPVLCANGDENRAVAYIKARRSTDGLVAEEAWCEFCIADFDEEPEPADAWVEIARRPVPEPSVR